jgi:hypothetical protein
MFGGGKRWLEKKDVKDATNQADKDVELEAEEAAEGKMQLIMRKRKCKGCGESGHGQTSYKCKLNGTKKMYHLLFLVYL